MLRSLVLFAGKVAITSSRVARERPRAAIEISELAASRLRSMLVARPDAIGIKVGVKTRGCNGQSYTMNYATAKGKHDEEVADKAVRIFIEPNALLKIVGTRMDWKEDDLTAEFVFTNPNAKSVCGCGESFNV